MKISISQARPTEVRADVLAVAVRPEQLGKDAVLRSIDAATNGALARAIAADDYKAGRGETLTLNGVSGLAASRLLLIGLGRGPVREPGVRLAAAKAASAAQRLESVALFVDGSGKWTRTISEGFGLGAYRYTAYLTGDRKPKKQLAAATILLSRPDPKANDGISRGNIVASAINLARDLVNAPPNDMTPTALAEAARTAAKDAGIECTILDKKAIEKQGMHLLLAVARGSGQEPRFIHMKYVPKGAAKGKRKRIVFVGKGLTFDSGGLCIKPAKPMYDMKCDMAGGAVTIAIVAAAAKLKLPVEVHGIVPATENMSGDHAYRPSDVFPSLEGKTVEIINTDAEGRLILADALAYGLALEPDAMIDHATLTGACMVALGAHTAGLFANDDGLASRYLRAASETGESAWRLPLNDDLRDLLKSDIADIKHTGESHGGAITAALFLREFVGKSKWLHMDIAGPAFAERARGVHPKGGTGYGVLTALRYLEALGR